jgi:thiosulfate/3-mercaptopyruvate sulfurtransferase
MDFIPTLSISATTRESRACSVGFGPLVTADWLRRHVDDADLRVIDFRWYLQGKNGRDEFMQGHVPHAVFLNLEAVTGTDGGGRHPLPSVARFEREMRRCGVSDETKVVAYDDAGGATAARLWFLLGYFGHRSQAVLDGGVEAWGGPLATEVERFPAGDFKARHPDPSRVLDYDTVRTLGGVPLIDARAGERYRGEKEPIDPKAGHIPGAISAPFTENLDSEKRFRSPAELRRRYEALGAGDGAVFYCGSGVNATHDILAMEIAGLPGARLYAGSWSDWCNRPGAPVATGPEP